MKKINLFVSRSLMLMFALVFVVASCKKETVEPIVEDPIVEDPILNFDVSGSFIDIDGYSGKEGTNLRLVVEHGNYPAIGEIGTLNDFDDIKLVASVETPEFPIGNLTVGNLDIYYLTLFDDDNLVLYYCEIQIEEGTYNTKILDIQNETIYAKIDFVREIVDGNRIFKIKILI